MKLYVLVHGGCHGAWCWYKVKPVLEASGHRVTVVDLTASGVNMSRVEEIQSLEDYTKPLLKVFESFGSEDMGLTEVFQRWVIENFPVKEVMEIKNADHMPMFSKPLELCDRLLKIADKYA